MSFLSLVIFVVASYKLFFLSQIRRSIDDSWAVIGLSSWGDGCATKGKYGVYTRLKSHLRWIKRKTNRKSSKKNKD